MRAELGRAAGSGRSSVAGLEPPAFVYHHPLDLTPTAGRQWACVVVATASYLESNALRCAGEVASRISDSCGLFVVLPDADRCCQQGQRLRVLWGHAMLSDALFEEIVGSCPTELSVLPDCMQLTTLPECGVVPPSYNSDRLRLSSMRPGDCTRTAVS